MPATAATRPPPTEGPRLRNRRLLRESAPWGAAGRGGGAALGLRPLPWAASEATAGTASSAHKSATGRRRTGNIGRFSVRRGRLRRPCRNTGGGTRGGYRRGGGGASPGRNARRPPRARRRAGED